MNIRKPAAPPASTGSGWYGECGRCGQVTSGYLQHTWDGYGSLGYWSEAGKYGTLCDDCIKELKEEYRRRWEREYGAEMRSRGYDNPY